jgi:hypothetical protein
MIKIFTNDPSICKLLADRKSYLHVLVTWTYVSLNCMYCSHDSLRCAGSACPRPATGRSTPGTFLKRAKSTSGNAATHCRLWSSLIYEIFLCRFRLFSDTSSIAEIIYIYIYIYFFFHFFFHKQTTCINTEHIISYIDNETLQHLTRTLPKFVL